MSHARFAQLKPFFATLFQRSHDLRDWAEIRDAVDGYNKKRRIYVSASSFKVLDKVMCACRPRQDKFGGFPHISFVARKPKPFGESPKGHFRSHLF